MGNNGTVPEHGKCLELCRIMGNDRSCAVSWEMPGLCRNMGNNGMKQKVAGNGILKENKKNWIWKIRKK